VTPGRLLAFLSFRRISGQIAALVAASLITIHLIITGFFIYHRSSDPQHAERPRREIGTLAQLLGATPPAERPRLLEDVRRAFPQLAIDLTDAGPRVSSDDQVDASPDYPVHHLGPGFSAFKLSHAPYSDSIGIRLPDGSLLTARLGPQRTTLFFGSPWVLTLLFIIASITLLGLWAARALSAPLTAFAKAAESFSLSGSPAPLPESGPDEIRFAAKALNRMRERILTLMNDRTRMFAAISHDLRTPITRLRLRSEFIEDEIHRNQTLMDLDQMRSMLESVLSFLRNDHTVEPMTLIDLPAMLHQICDQFADLGYKVSYLGPAHVTITARPDELSRAITNLVENAVRFGTTVVISLDVSGTRSVIEVQDDGPGIDDASKAVVLEPFVRGDDARNMDESAGFGLGLSITQAIIAAHGGALSLHDRQPHGLIARVALPAEVRQKSAA
jgi:signal transduction histidine kinase